MAGPTPLSRYFGARIHLTLRCRLAPREGSLNRRIPTRSSLSSLRAATTLYEAGRLHLHTLGYAVTTGVTLGIVRKANMIVWAGLGIIALLRRAVPSAVRKVLDRHPRLRKAMDNLVLSNIAHRPARTFVSVLGVAVGVLLVVLRRLAHGLTRRGRRRPRRGDIIVLARATWLVARTLAMPSRAPPISCGRCVRGAVPVGQTTSD